MIPKLHQPSGSNVWCGPNTLSSLLGRSTDEICELVLEKREERNDSLSWLKVKGMSRVEYGEVLEHYGVDYEPLPLPHLDRPAANVREAVTLQDWLQYNEHQHGRFALFLPKHVMLARVNGFPNVQIVDTRYDWDRENKTCPVLSYAESKTSRRRYVYDAIAIKETPK